MGAAFSCGDAEEGLTATPKVDTRTPKRTQQPQPAACLRTPRTGRATMSAAVAGRSATRSNSAHKSGVSNEEIAEVKRQCRILSRTIEQKNMEVLHFQSLIENAVSGAPGTGEGASRDDLLQCLRTLTGAP